MDGGGPNGVASSQVAIIDHTAAAGQRKVVKTVFTHGREAHGLWVSSTAALLYVAHEGAVETARLVLLHGRDPLVRKLAEEIIAAQQTEIATMRQRLEILRTGRDMTPGGFPALGGTRGPVAP